MGHLDKIFKRKKKEKYNKKLELAKEKHEDTEKVYDFKFEVMNIGDKEKRVLKRTFEPIVKEVVKELNQKGTELDTIYKAIIPPEAANKLSDGSLSFMKSTDGNLLPNIVNKNNKIEKIVRLEEVNVAPQDVAVMDQLNEKILNQTLDDISAQLAIVIELAKEINKTLQNNTYGQVIGAIRSIEQSYLSEGRNSRQQIQNNSQGRLNESIAILEIELEDGIQYFKSWDNRRPFINNYTSNRNEEKFNKLMEDYLYLNTAKSALIELKRKQGMSSTNLKLMTKDLKNIEKQLKDAEIGSWLPPRTIDNHWQHELINHIELKNSRIVINYSKRELLKEGGGLYHD